MIESLKKNVLNKIYTKIPHLQPEKNTFGELLSHPSSSILIVLFFILTLFGLSLFVARYFCWDIITLNNAGSINSGSNQVLASIFGIAFVVIGFVFTELSSKSFINFNYLSRVTFIFPITYSGFLNIALMLLLSLTETSLVNINYVGQVGYNNAVIFCHYYILFNIVLIIILYVRVTKFMDDNFIYEDYKQSIFKKAKSILLQEKIREYAKIELLELYTERSMSPHSIFSTDNPHIISIQKKGYVEDVDIGLLKRDFPIETNGLTYTMININDAIETKQTLVWGGSVVALEKPYIITKNLQSSDEGYFSHLRDFKNTFITSVKNENLLDSEKMLNTFSELYDIYFQSQK
jgi:hypothetical protein